ADETDQHDLEAIDEVGDDRDDHVDRHGPIERAAVLADDALVDAVLHEERPGEHGEGPQRHEDAGGHHQSAVRPQHRHRPSQHVDGLLAVELVLFADGAHEEHQTVTSASSTTSASASAAIAAASTSR